MFLQWINQILGCLDSSLINVIGPLLIRLSKVYPKAIQLPLRTYMEKDIYNNEECESFLKTKYASLMLYIVYLILCFKFKHSIFNLKCCSLKNFS